MAFEEYSIIQHKHDDVYVNSYDVEEELLNFTLPVNRAIIIDITAISSTLLTVVGFVTNCMCIAVFSSAAFDRMSYAVLMKILCMYNIIVLILGSFQYHSLHLDDRRNTARNSRRYFCTYLLWFVHVFRHGRTASVMLILYNRIKAFGDRDYFYKSVDAMRFPILGNTFFLLLSTVYVSRYIDQMDVMTKTYNKTECLYPFMVPYHRDITADVMMSNMPVFEHSIIVFMLLVIFCKFVIRKRRNSAISIPKSDSMSSQIAPIPAREILLGKLSRRSTIAVGPRYGIYYLSDLLHQNSAISIIRRDVAVNTMTVVITILNTATSGFRDTPDSFIAQDMYPLSMKLLSSFVSKSLLDLTFFFYLATMFFFMCASSSHFRRAAYSVFYTEAVDSSRSDSSMANRSSQIITASQQGHRGSFIRVDPLESAPGSRNKDTNSMEEERDTEAILTGGSVWSLDKAYFLNATKQYAIVEKF